MSGAEWVVGAGVNQMLDQRESASGASEWVKVGRDTHSNAFPPGIRMVTQESRRLKPPLQLSSTSQDTFYLTNL